MARKKVETKKAVIFIVEGRSDKKALENIIQKIYQYKDIVFKFMDGDITSDKNVNKLNVQNLIYEQVEEYRKDKKLKKSDIWEIVHIFDTDGTYIPDEAIEAGDSSKFFYTPDKIFCKNVESVIARNKVKREMMDYLLSLDNIKGIPYIGANSHFLRTAGPYFPDSPGHIKRTAWDISRAEGTPPH